MPFEYVPLLETQREIYILPRGLERFRWYLQTMLNTEGDGLDDLRGGWTNRYITLFADWAMTERSGDEAAKSLGYALLGFSARASLTLVLVEALESGSQPEDALTL